VKGYTDRWLLGCLALAVASGVAVWLLRRDDSWLTCIVERRPR
jgi:hypothetical protein